MNSPLLVKSLAAGVLLSLTLTLPARLAAAEFLQTNRFTLAADQAQAGELWVRAASIQIDGTMQDDLLAVATGDSLWQPGPGDGTVTLTGGCSNDVWAIGRIILVNGPIRDHARLLGNTIKVSNRVDGSAILIGNTIHLSRASEIGKDALLIGENAIVEGTLKGATTFLGQRITLSGAFKETVHITAPDIVVLPGAVFEGDLIYCSDRELVLDPKATLKGKLIRDSVVASSATTSAASWLILQLFFFLGALMVGSVFMTLFPLFTTQAVNQLRTAPWKCLLIGFVAVSLTPMVAFFTFISIIGIPLCLVALTSMGLLLYFGKIAVAITVGGLILHQGRPFHRAFGPLFLGLAVVYLACGTGWMGLLAWLLVAGAGAGAMILTLISRPTPVVINLPTPNAPTPQVPPPLQPPQP